MGKILKAVAIVGAIAINVIPGAGQAISAAVLGSTLASSTIAAGLTAGALFSTALTTGLLALGAPGAPKQAGGLPDLGRLQLRFDPNAPRKMVFGETAMAADVVYVEPSDSDQRYVDAIIHLASHRIHSLDRVYINDELAWTNAGGAQGKYAGYLTIQWIAQADASHYHTLNGGVKWGAHTRLSGCATAHIRIDRQGHSKNTASPLVNGLPSNMRFVGRGMPLYDPRLDSTRGGIGLHRLDDNGTWEFVSGGTEIGKNPILQEFAWRYGWRYMGEVACGRGMPERLLPIDRVAMNASICEEQVPLTGGGSNQRYQSGGLVPDNQDYRQTQDNFALACNAAYRDVRGKLSLECAIDDLAGATIELTDDDVLGDVTYTPFAENIVNIVHGQYPEPAGTALYQLAPFPEVRSADFVPGETVPHALPLDFALVQSSVYAVRLARLVYNRQQFQGRVSFRCGIRAWKLPVGEPVLFSFSQLGWQQRPWRVEERRINLDGSADLVLREEHASIYLPGDDDNAPIIARDPEFYDPTTAPGVKIQPVDWSDIIDDGGKPEDGATRNVYRGLHSTANSYQAGDTVTNAAGDEVYVAIQDVPAGKALSDAAYWSLMVSAGGGAPGINTATIFLYQRTASDSAPALPGSTLTYNFGTMGLSGSLGGWSRSLPASGGAYRWMTTATASSATATDSIAPAEWAAAALHATDGLNTAVVTLYKRGITTPAMPSGTFAYSFASGVLSGGDLNGWTQSHQASDGTPEWIIQASAVGVGATDSIVGGEFSAPVQLVADGKDYRADIREDFNQYADIADVRRHWDITDGAGGDATASLMAGAGYTGGMRVQVTGRAHFIARQKYAFDAEDLYRVKARLYVETVGSGNRIYIGAKMMDLGGSNMPSDAGTYHYFAAANVAVSNIGWMEFEGYFRGTALVGGGNNVGAARPDPSTPGRAASGSASFSPIALINNAGTGGKASLDYIEIGKVEDLTPLPSRPWAAGVLQQRGQVVTYGGRSWIARVDNSNVQPPSTGIGNATWALLADKGADGDPGRDAVVFFQDATPVGAIAGDTWMRRTEPYTWQKYNGSSWEPMGGTVGRYDVLVASMLLLDGVTLTGDGSGRLIIKSQGVDTQQLAVGSTGAAGMGLWSGTYVDTAPAAWRDVIIDSTIVQRTVVNNSSRPATVTVMIFANVGVQYSNQNLDRTFLRLMDGATVIGAAVDTGPLGGTAQGVPFSTAWLVTIPASSTRTYRLQASASPLLAAVSGVKMVAILDKSGA